MGGLLRGGAEVASEQEKNEGRMGQTKSFFFFFFQIGDITHEHRESALHSVFSRHSVRPCLLLMTCVCIYICIYISYTQRVRKTRLLKLIIY